MATVNPGDRFQRTRKGRQRVFECRAIQADAFHRWGGVALFRWPATGYERLVPLAKLDTFLKTAKREA